MSAFDLVTPVYTKCSVFSDAMKWVKFGLQNVLQCNVGKDGMYDMPLCFMHVRKSNIRTRCGL